MDPTFNTADKALTDYAWGQVVNDGLAVIEAASEADLDAQIQQHIDTVAQTDVFNANPRYKEYMEGELRMQKQQALDDWELAAQLAIEARRELSLTTIQSGLMRKIRDCPKFGNTPSLCNHRHRARHGKDRFSLMGTAGPRPDTNPPAPGIRSVAEPVRASGPERERSAQEPGPAATR